jgi:hypothetical protein
MSVSRVILKLFACAANVSFPPKVSFDHVCFGLGAVIRRAPHQGRLRADRVDRHEGRETTLAASHLPTGADIRLVFRGVSAPMNHDVNPVSRWDIARKYAKLVRSL